MPLLSPQTEARIVGAVEQLYDMTKEAELSASSINEAALKIASANKLTPDMIRLLCVGYNTATATQQREAASSVLEKHAEFPLADAEYIIKKLYAEPAKQAAASTTISQDYFQAPKNPVRKTVGGGTLKTASATISVEMPSAKLSEIMAASYSVAQETSRLNSQVKVAELESEIALDRLAAYYKQATFKPRVSAGELLYYLHNTDKAAALVGDMALSELKVASVMPKQAISRSDAPVALSYEALDKLNDLLDLQAKLACHNKTAAALKAIVADGTKAAELGTGFLGAAAAGTLMSNAASDYFNNTTRQALVDRQLSQLTDPDHEERLRSIRGRSMLQDFLTNDDVLRTHDPAKVMQAYNELNQLGPRAAQQPSIARAVLRKWMTQGGVEPFETKEVTDLEKNIAQTQNASKPVSISGGEKRSASQLPNKILDATADGMRKIQEEMIPHGFIPDTDHLANNTLTGMAGKGVLGGAIGAGLGGLAGMWNESKKKEKERNYLAGALTGAGLGGAVGGLGGAAIGGALPSLNTLSESSQGKLIPYSHPAQ